MRGLHTCERGGALTQHLGGIHVQLVSDDSSKSSDKHREDVIVAIEERVRPNNKNYLRSDLVPHRQSDRYLSTTRRSLRHIDTSGMLTR